MYVWCILHVRKNKGNPFKQQYQCRDASIKTVMNYLTLCFVSLGNPHRSSPYQLQLRRTMCRAREWTVTISAAVTQASWQMRSSCLWTAWTVISQVWLTFMFLFSIPSLSYMLTKLFTLVHILYILFSENNVEHVFDSQMTTLIQTTCLMISWSCISISWSLLQCREEEWRARRFPAQ